MNFLCAIFFFLGNWVISNFWVHSFSLTHISGNFVCFDKIRSDMNIQMKCLQIKRTKKQAYALRDHLALVIKSLKKNKDAQRSDHAEKSSYRWIFALNLSDFCFSPADSRSLQLHFQSVWRQFEITSFVTLLKSFAARDLHVQTC